MTTEKVHCIRVFAISRFIHNRVDRCTFYIRSMFAFIREFIVSRVHYSEVLLYYTLLSVVNFVDMFKLTQTFF